MKGFNETIISIAYVFQVEGRSNYCNFLLRHPNRNILNAVKITLKLINKFNFIFSRIFSLIYIYICICFLLENKRYTLCSIV